MGATPTDRSDEWRRRADRWVDIDPDPETANLLAEISAAAGTDSEARERLGDLVGSRLDFGTAGLRGRRGPGPNRMNRLVIRQTAAGLADVLVSDHADDLSRPVLVTFDARWLSDVFALDVADVLGAAGVRVLLASGAQPTPFASWTMRQIGAIAAVVVTASHNPPADSGIKIYWDDGAQIIPPVDGRIADAIAGWADRNPPGSDLAPQPLDPTWIDRYVAFAAGMATDDSTSTPLRLVTTALHGVGGDMLGRTLAASGFDDVTEVAEQRDPDPDFPTVTFPNPEEPGATDLLLALARRTSSDVALALDPDADRLAMGCPGENGWAMLTGDELGALLCQGLLDVRSDSPRSAMVVSTVVSSRLAGRIARARGARFCETLTGFKWLCRPGLANPELDVVLAYEEALGYAVGGLLDKDGISAAAVVASLCRRWKREGRDPRGVLDDLAVEFGAHVQLNTSVRRDGPGATADVAALGVLFADDPPDRLADTAVASMDRPAPDVIRLYVGDDDRVVIRPSGTEPKLKFYCEAVEPVRSGENPTVTRRRARARLERIQESLMSFMSGPR